MSRQSRCLAPLRTSVPAALLRCRYQKRREAEYIKNRQLASPEIDRRVNALLAKMTLEEKLGQLVQYNTVGATSATVAAGQEADLATNPKPITISTPCNSPRPASSVPCST